MRKFAPVVGLSLAAALLAAGCFQVPPAFFFAAVAGAVGAGGGGGGGGGSSGVTLSGRVAFPPADNVTSNDRREREPNDRAGHAERVGRPESGRLDALSGETQARIRLLALRPPMGSAPAAVVERDLLAGTAWTPVPCDPAGSMQPFGRTPSDGDPARTTGIARSPDALYLLEQASGGAPDARLLTYAPTGGMPRATHHLVVTGEIVGLAATSDLVFILERPVVASATMRLSLLDAESGSEVTTIDLGPVAYRGLAAARDIVEGTLRLFTADATAGLIHELDVASNGATVTISGAASRSITAGSLQNPAAALAYDGIFLHVADRRDGSVHILDPASGLELAVVPGEGEEAPLALAALYDPGLDGFLVTVDPGRPVDVALRGVPDEQGGAGRDIFFLGLDRQAALQGDAPALLFEGMLDARGRTPWQRLAAPRRGKARSVDLVVGSLLGRTSYRLIFPGGSHGDLQAPPPVSDEVARALARALRDSVVPRITADRLTRLYCDWQLAPHVPGRVVLGTRHDAPFVARDVVPGMEIAVEARGESPFTRVRYRLTDAWVRTALPRVNGVTVPAGLRREASRELLLLCGELSADEGVRWCEPDYLVHALSTTPNDEHYPLQWNLTMIGMPEAWDTTRGSSSVRVAVVDSGVRTEQLDIVSRLVDGYDFITVDGVNGDGDGIDPDPFDESGPESHGTHVGGIIAAVTNNTLGVAGTTWEGQIMPLRALGGADGSGSGTDVAEAIYYAARHANASGALPSKAADVINLSLGTAETIQAMVEAIQEAVSKDIVVVAATGNENTVVGFPANMVETIAVAAVSKQKLRPSYSNFGPEVDLAAPGGTVGKSGVLSTVGDLDDDGIGDFGYLAGTSMACPHVSAAAALMLSLNPDLTPEEIRSVLRDTAEDLGAAGVDDDYGAGLLDMAAVVQADISPELSLPASSVDFGLNGRHLAVQAANSGVGRLQITGFEKSAVEGGTTAWLAVSTLADGKTISLAADRSQISAGSYLVDVLVKSNGGDQTVQAALTKDGSTLPKVGGVLIEIRDASDNLVASVKTSSQLNYLYTLDGVSAGKVFVRCGVDENGNGRIGDAGEPFGAYPNASSPALLDLSALSTLDLDILLEGL